MSRLAPFLECERKVFRPAEDLTVSEWAAKYRVLDEQNSGEPGPWSNDRAPHLVGIMDAFCDGLVERISVKKCVQIGMTEATLNMLGFAVDQDPCSVIYAVARSLDIAHWQMNRVLPMIQSSPKLSAKMTGRKTDAKARQFVFDRGALYFRAAQTKADLQSQPARVVIGDEVDRWGTWTQGEGDPTELLADRTTTFWRRKIVFLSTPTRTTGHIHRLYESSDQRRYHVPCPVCGHYQPLEFDRVKRPSKDIAPDALRAQRLAYYECRSCEAAIPDQQRTRSKMLARGVWVPQGGSVSSRGEVTGDFKPHAGFHLSSLISPWKTWSQTLAHFLEVKSDPPKLMVFVNQQLGECWLDKARETSTTLLASLAVPGLKAGTVPPGAQALTAGVDVQQDHFWVAIRAWGFDMESWLVTARRVETWQGLWDLLSRPWPIAQLEGKEHEPIQHLQVLKACIDSNHRTWEVYEECGLHMDIAVPVRGADGKTGGLPMRPAKVGRNPETGQVVPGLLRWDVSTIAAKDKISALQRVPAGDPGGWHCHEDPPDYWLEQCSAERQVFERHPKTGIETMVWRPKHAGIDNHLWDCEVYALLAAQLLELWTLRSDVRAQAELEAQQRAVQRQRRRAQYEEHAGWLDGVEGMM